ncbi:CCA tRNA nucleotidyltransferase [Kyrpidia spormannii]|uniref:CCA tRNA nucleotidyltransferase n=2 Tax=Kyrpidia spormannii TaxID=2055160 RepID=A0A2K8N6B0_9BACL|nr:CCA tRNA nucleotidyltransferase [Kyrpidia spormannii]
MGWNNCSAEEKLGGGQGSGESLGEAGIRGGKDMQSVAGIRVWRAAEEVIAALTDAGWEAVYVGGGVRDLLLGRGAKDVDIATAAPPEAVMKVFPEAVPTGLAFGTVTIPRQGIGVEVTTYRREGGYRDRRRPSQVEYTPKLEEDLGRRDFTINAMAMSRGFRLIDPFGGLEDLLAGQIRAVGDPAQRFAEDALRMVRALRLAAELSFDLDPSVVLALNKQVKDVRYVAVERVLGEWRRLVVGDVDKVARELAACGFLEWWTGMPVGRDRGLQVAAVWGRACRRLPRDSALRTGVLLWMLGCTRQHAAAMTKAWRASRLFQRDVITWWEACHFDPLRAEPGDWARWLYHLGRERAEMGLRVVQAVRGYGEEEEMASREAFRRAVEAQPLWDRRDFATEFETLCRAAHIPPGPLWGEAERALREALLNGQVANDPRALGEYLAHWVRGRRKMEGGQ